MMAFLHLGRRHRLEQISPGADGSDGEPDRRQPLTKSEDVGIECVPMRVRPPSLRARPPRLGQSLSGDDGAESRDHRPDDARLQRGQRNPTITEAKHPVLFKRRQTGDRPLTVPGPSTQGLRPHLEIRLRRRGPDPVFEDVKAYRRWAARVDQQEMRASGREQSAPPLLSSGPQDELDLALHRTDETAPVLPPCFNVVKGLKRGGLGTLGR